MELHARPSLVILTDFTSASHVLFGEALKNDYADFRLRVLRQAEWATWHSNLSGPYPKGWCIRKANLEELVAALKTSGIPFEIKEYPRAHSKVSRTKTSLHPTFKVMICKAIQGIKDHRGASRAAIKKYILTNWNVSEKVMTSHFNYYIKRLVTKGYLVPIYRGTRVASRFKVANKFLAETKTRKRTKKPALVGTVSPIHARHVLPVKSDDVLEDTTYIQKWFEWTNQAPDDRVVIYQSGDAYYQIIVIDSDDRKTYVGPADGGAEVAYETVAKIAWSQYHAKKIDEALLDA